MRYPFSLGLGVVSFLLGWLPAFSITTGGMLMTSTRGLYSTILLGHQRASLAHLRQSLPNVISTFPWGVMRAKTLGGPKPKLKASCPSPENWFGLTAYIAGLCPSVPQDILVYRETHEPQDALSRVHSQGWRNGQWVWAPIAPTIVWCLLKLVPPIG
jgi:hypothetical protein